ncbi:MAG: hypothetical protein DRQ44_15660 [Gammaproteobacteria bacterium]|nr:MAG: hypothetical protein DRQ44_15660 [Gammaproteobacteria bacterium]
MAALQSMVSTASCRLRKISPTIKNAIMKRPPRFLFGLSLVLLAWVSAFSFMVDQSFYGDALKTSVVLTGSNPERVLIEIF